MSIIESSKMLPIILAEMENIIKLMQEEQDKINSQLTANLSKDILD